MRKFLKFRREDGNYETVKKKISILARLKNNVVEKRITTERVITTKNGTIIGGSTKSETSKFREP